MKAHAFPELLEAHLEELRRQGLAPASRRQVHSWVSAFLEFCRAQGVTEPAQLTAEHLPAYHQHLLWTPTAQGRRYAANTLDQMRRMVRTFLRWLRSERHLAHDLTAGLVWGRPTQPVQRRLTAEEAEQLMRSLPDDTPLGLRNRALLQLFYHGRLTREQAMGLDLADVSLRTRQLNLRLGRSPRMQAIGDELATALSRYLWEGRPKLQPQVGERRLLLTVYGTRMKGECVQVLVAQLGHRAGLSQVSPRLLARSCPSRTPN